MKSHVEPRSGLASAPELLFAKASEIVPMPRLRRNLGTPLFDNCDLEAAAEQAAKLRRSTFCMMVAPLRVPGATGSPFNPLAPF